MTRAATASLLAAAALGLAACGGSPDPTIEAAADEPAVRLSGGGGVFPPGLFEEWTARFAASGDQVDVQDLGADRGIERLLEGKLAFATADRPLSDDEVDDAGGAVLHVPAAVTRVAVIHNVDGIDDGLRLTGKLLARILLGEIDRWDVRAIRRLSESRTALPNQPIVICHPSKPAGQTLVLSRWLSDALPAWRRGPGEGREVRWPTGTGIAEDAGVASCVRQNPGAIGYVDGAFAEREKLRTVALRNAAGQFVAPSARAAARAVAGELEADEGDLRLDPLGTTGESAYPMSGVVFLLVGRDACRNQGDEAGATLLANWLRYVVGPGQDVVRSLDQTPLPDAVRARSRKQAKALRCDGRPLAPTGS